MSGEYKGDHAYLPSKCPTCGKQLKMITYYGSGGMGSKGAWMSDDVTAYFVCHNCEVIKVYGRRDGKESWRDWPKDVPLVLQ